MRMRVSAVTMETCLLFFCACADNMWHKAWFIYSIIRHIHLSGQLLEPRCPDNRGSTVVYAWTTTPSWWRLVLPCTSHSCHHCGAEEDSLATHGPSCMPMEWRHRHAALNDIVHRALSTTKIPARFEPSGLQRSCMQMGNVQMVSPWYIERVRSCYSNVPRHINLSHPTLGVQVHHP